MGWPRALRHLLRRATRAGGSGRAPRTGGRKPRIVVVGHAAGAEIFGAERSLLDVLSAVDRNLYELTCVLPAHDDRYTEAVREHTKDVVVFPYTWWTLARPIRPRTVARFEAVFRELRADLVHVNTIALQDPLEAARRLGIRRIVHARELILEDSHLIRHFGVPPAEIVARVIASTDVVVANSDATLAMYRKPGASYRLYNRVDVARLDLPSASRGGPLRVGILSSNTPAKGIDAFVELAVRADRLHLAMEFLVFGPRTEVTARLLERAPESGLPRNLRFYGYVADPMDALREVHLIVSLSDYPESFGRTLAEAMSTRRPVIAYDWGGVPELVRPGVDGFLVPRGDLAQVLAHLRTLEANRDQVHAMGSNGRSRVVALCAPEVFAPQLNEIYRRAFDLASST